MVTVAQRLLANETTPTGLAAGSRITLDSPGSISISDGNTDNIAVTLPSLVDGKRYLFDLPNTTPGQNQNSTFGTADPSYLPQYSAGGGNVTINAQRDIIHLGVGGVDDSEQQLPVNWLYRRSIVDINGFFATSYNGDIASTTWWVDYSNFFEGVGALGGGNVTLTAGRDVKNVDAVVPTNAWMPSATVTASGVDKIAADQQLFENGGGNLLISAGRNIDGGVYYVERGQGTLTAGNEVTTNATRTTSSAATGPSGYSADSLSWLPTTLFVGQGSFDVSAQNDILLGEVLNVFLLPQGLGNSVNLRSYFLTYASDSGLSVQSLTGDITLRGDTADAAHGAGVATGMDGWFVNVLGGGVSAQRPWLRLEESLRPSTFASPPDGVWDTYSGYGVKDINDWFSVALHLRPGTLSSTAFSGDINLMGSLTFAPSATGNIDLLAADSINGFQKVSSGKNSRTLAYGCYQTASINLSDADPAKLPSVSSPLPISYTSSSVPIPQSYLVGTAPLMTALDALFAETGASQGSNTRSVDKQARHDADLLHTDDLEPIHLYAQMNDISGVQLFAPKIAQVIAGHDIKDIALYLQNLENDDVSQVIAGRDIIAYDENTAARLAAGSSIKSVSGVWDPLSGDIVIGGPGTLEVLAGRDLSLGGTPTNGSIANGTGLGIQSVGDSRNPYLPFNDGADIIAAAGLGQGTGIGLAGSTADFSAFISAFLDPTTSGAQATRYLPDLGALLGISSGNTDSIWKAFELLPDDQKDKYALDIFYLVLRDAGRDHNDANSANYGNYKTGYQAIDTLFPGNAWKGDMSLTAREIKTDSDGDINLLIPGGQLLVGYDLGGRQPLDQGILTTSGGNISIFSHDSVSVGTSRIFTFKGGNEIIWSTTGDIAAGSASKTLQSAPPARYKIDPATGVSLLDLAGLATGGGIGVLQTLQGVPPGDIDLIAPVGVVDAGDAGIRVSGNLNIAAVRVLNAANIEVQVNSTGTPVAAAAPNVGAMAAANNTAGAATNSMDTATQSSNAASQEAAPSVFDVQVVGYGMIEQTKNDESPKQDAIQSPQAYAEPSFNNFPR